MTVYIIQRRSLTKKAGQQYEPIKDAKFRDKDQAIATLRRLEIDHGLRNLRVVADNGPRYSLAGNLRTGDYAHDVIFMGEENPASDG